LHQSEIPLKNLFNLLFINQNYDFIKLKGEVIRLKVGELSPQVRTEKAELEKMIAKIRDKLAGVNLDKVLELYLQTNQKTIQEKKEKDPFIKGQLAVFSELLQEKINLEELQMLLDKQKKFLELESHLTQLQDQLLNLGKTQIQSKSEYDDYEYEVTSKMFFYEEANSSVVRNELVSSIEKKLKLPRDGEKNYQQEIETSPSEKLTELFLILFPNKKYNFKELEREIKKLKFADLSPHVQQEKNELERLITSNKNKVGNQSEKFLELLLKLHQKAVEEKKETEPFVEGQLSACNSLLSETLTELELQQLLTKQKKATQLQQQLTNLQITKEQTIQQLQAQIQIPPKQN